MTKRNLIFCILIFITCSLQAQSVDTAYRKEIVTKRSLAVLIGYSAGSYSYGEIGFSKNSSTSVGHHPSYSGWIVSSEFRLGKKAVIGPKIGAWVSGGMSAIVMGLNMLYYTDFDRASLALRPEIGVGIENFKLIYGYNLMLAKNKPGGLNSNLVGLTLFFKTKKLNDNVKR